MGDLRFDGGSLALNLVATVGRRFGDPVERLTSVERLREWLTGVGLEPDSDLDRDCLERTRRLREDLDVLFRAALAGEQLPTAPARAVDAAAARAPRLSGPVTLDDALGLVAADAVRILTTKERGDLRVCAAADCRMVYLRHGERERRWCSSQRCGNRSRVAAHRARAAAGA